MAKALRYYWDACAWIGLINREPKRFDSLLYVIELAQAGKAQIWTSTFTLAEVFKKKCGEGPVGVPPTSDVDFEDFIAQEFVQRVQVDTDVGTVARRLLRQFPKIKKPQDAIHAATAALNDVDELHTFDGSDLLAVSDLIPMPNGQKLVICKPPKRPDPMSGTMFAQEEGKDGS